METTLVLLAAIITIASVLGWVGVLLWSAIQDGREQRRHERLLADNHVPVDFVRLSGCPVSDDGALRLINQLVAEGTPEAHQTAQRIAIARLTRRDADLPLTPAERNVVLTAIPDPTPEDLADLRDVLLAAATGSRSAPDPATPVAHTSGGAPSMTGRG